MFITQFQPIIISAETGEAVDDDAAPTEDSICSSGSAAAIRDCRFSPGLIIFDKLKIWLKN